MRRHTRNHKGNKLQITTDEENVKRVLTQTYLPFKPVKNNINVDADGDIIMSCAHCEKLVISCICRNN